MTNSYGLPEDELAKIYARDKTCVYCRKMMIEHTFTEERRDWSTIEHLNHLPPWNNASTVAIACMSCNASRSNYKISDWFKTQYCLSKNINEDTVAEPVRQYIQNIEKFLD